MNSLVDRGLNKSTASPARRKRRLKGVELGSAPHLVKNTDLGDLRRSQSNITDTTLTRENWRTNVFMECAISITYCRDDLVEVFTARCVRYFWAAVREQSVWGDILRKVEANIPMMMTMLLDETQKITKSSHLLNSQSLN